MLPDLLDGVAWEGDGEAVSAAAGQVRDLCGWHVAPVVTETVTLPRSSSGLYLLPSLRVVSVDAVVVGGVAVSVFDWATDGRLELFPVWSGSRLRGPTVTFTHGFEVCPPGVRQAVLARATQLGAQRVRSQAQGVGPYSQSITYFDADVASDLAPYRLPAVA